LLELPAGTRVIYPPPPLDAVEPWLLLVTAKVEKSAFVSVPSQDGQTCRSSRLAKLPKTSNVWRHVRQENS